MHKLAIDSFYILKVYYIYRVLKNSQSKILRLLEYSVYNLHCCLVTRHLLQNDVLFDLLYKLVIDVSLFLVIVLQLLHDCVS